MWMNDPNGPIYWQGWYHVSYQFNPYGEQWGNMHWGHARSRDLVNWEHLPIAIPPSRGKGEDHVFSGSTFLDGRGRPAIFYTSIGNRAPEQWVAVPTDGDLVGWRKPSANPVVSVKTHAPTNIEEWRDPFLFTEGGHTYMVTGGRHEGKGAVAAYKALNPDLTRWEFVGLPFHHPDSNLIECPNLVKLGDRWVLLTSHDGRVDWFAGTMALPSGHFQSQQREVLAEGSYASQLLRDRDGNAVHLAWMPTNNRQGWNGYLTLPSTLKLDVRGVLRRAPIRELEKLRGEEVQFPLRELSSAQHLAVGDQFEVVLEVEPGTARGIDIQVGAPDAPKISYDFSTKTLRSSGRSDVKVADEPLKLHLFIDRSALDLYADSGRVSYCTSFLPKSKVDGVTITPVGGTLKVKRLTAYKLKGAEFAFTGWNM